jgi:23S rRNA (cytosine1962-C5)-methyltransferase
VASLSLVVHEDDHLLVVNKPAGWSTHAPSPYAGQGIYEWLKHREPAWARLAIIHRLDKETSGVLVFTKTPLANRSLTGQFTQGEVSKTYVLLTDRDVPPQPFTARSALVRVGEGYRSRQPHAGAALAATRFERCAVCGASRTRVAAQPLTGRTHQIRVHAAEHGFPILGDTFYGGTRAPRLFLHASELTLRHPATGELVTFRSAADFDVEPRLALRAAFLEREATDAFRLVHGAADRWPGWYVDRLGACLLSQSEGPLTEQQQARLAAWREHFGCRSVYHKPLVRRPREASLAETSPRLVLGEAAPAEWVVKENRAHFALRFQEGGSFGLFLDQRDNRRRLFTGHIAADFPAWRLPASDARVLNMFAYTCGFSVCAALAGARTTSVDLSPKYLAWGRRNFVLNGLEPTQHEFISGDAFDWLRRLSKKGRSFEVVLLDPPTFSTSKDHGAFRAEKDYPALVRAALPLVARDGVLFASTNAARLAPERFLSGLASSVQAQRRVIRQQFYAPQPPDFPLSRDEPAYLKTVWLRLA